MWSHEAQERYRGAVSASGFGLLASAGHLQGWAGGLPGAMEGFAGPPLPLPRAAPRFPEIPSHLAVHLPPYLQKTIYMLAPSHAHPLTLGHPPPRNPVLRCAVTPRWRATLSSLFQPLTWMAL